MKSLPLSSARLALVVWLLVSWLVATNHCALGLLKPAPGQSAQAHCQHCAPSPTHPAPPLQERECCQAIQGTVCAQHALQARGPDWLGEAALFQLGIAVVGQPPLLDDRRQIAEPPGSLSFAERVLQRSLPSHAPPHLV